MSQRVICLQALNLPGGERHIVFYERDTKKCVGEMRLTYENTLDLPALGNLFSTFCVREAQSSVIARPGALTVVPKVNGNH